MHHKCIEICFMKITLENVLSISNHRYLLLLRYPIKAKIAHAHLTVVKQLPSYMPYINDFATCMNWKRQIDTTNSKQLQIDSYTTWCKFYVHRMFLSCLQIKCGCTHFLLKLPTQFHLIRLKEVEKSNTFVSLQPII